MCARSKELIPGLLRRINQLEREMSNVRFNEFVQGEEVQIGKQIECPRYNWRSIVDTVLVVILSLFVVIIIVVIMV